MQRLAIILFSFFYLLTSANAAVYGFLKDTPISDFSDDDMEIMMQNIYKALDDTKDGEKRAWENEKTGHKGLANPLKTFKHKGMNCRTLRIINRSKAEIGESKFDFCKDKNNDWKVLSDKQNGKK